MSGRGLNLIELSVRSVAADLPCFLQSYLISTSLNQCQMSVSEDMEKTDLLGLIFPDEDPGYGDLFLTEGNNFLDDLLSEKDVCNLHVQ